MSSRAWVRPGSAVPTSRDLPASWIERVADGVLNLIFPDACLLCGLAVSRVRECGVCAACWDKARGQRLRPPWCPSCGLPLQTQDARDLALCGPCALQAPPFSGARSYGYYASELSRLVQAFKFDGRRNLASLLAPMLRVAFADSWSRDECDLIVPVPLHGQRKRERGYNQSALLAARLARDMVLPWSEAALTRTRDTPPQVGLTDARRLENLRSAFRSHHAGLVRGKRILLVDDVMTTGATVASASAALLEAGARSISVLTVARSVPGAR